MTNITVITQPDLYIQSDFIIFLYGDNDWVTNTIGYINQNINEDIAIYTNDQSQQVNTEWMYHTLYMSDYIFININNDFMNDNMYNSLLIGNLITNKNVWVNVDVEVDTNYHSLIKRLATNYCNNMNSKIKNLLQTYKEEN